MSAPDEPNPSPPVEPVEEAAPAPAAPAERYKSRIVIRPDGEVVIENLSMDLVALAQALDPDGELACEIAELLGKPAPGAKVEP